LAIEIDGESHFVEGADAHDRERQAIIESSGVSFLRFTNRDVYERLEGVMDKILQRLSASDLP
jgi:very-short-patch-repair endonuclease